jgi:3-hydroxy acid dehydrogenase / malonic semialdehyde reductase
MIKNKTVFITGASSGIGASCAELFAGAGVKLLLCARRLDTLRQKASAIQKKYGVDVHTFALDVCNRDEVSKALQELPAPWQTIDILVNNAGLALGLDKIQDAKVEDWDKMIDTNVKGLLYVTREVLPQMVARNAGHIINIGSIAGHMTYAQGTVYCATKNAVRVLSQGLRMDLFGTKIRVTEVDPGIVETNLSVVRFGGDIQRAAAVYQGINPLTANDIADSVLYCATRPLHVNINELIIMPTAQVSPTMIARQ